MFDTIVSFGGHVLAGAGAVSITVVVSLAWAMFSYIASWVVLGEDEVDKRDPLVVLLVGSVVLILFLLALAGCGYVSQLMLANIAVAQ